MDGNKHTPQQFREDDLPGIWKRTRELMESDRRDGTCEAASFLAGYSRECRSNLQWYVLGEHGESTSDELYEKVLKPDTPDEVSEWVDTQFGT